MRVTFQNNQTSRRESGCSHLYTTLEYHQFLQSALKCIVNAVKILVAPSINAQARARRHKRERVHAQAGEHDHFEHQTVLKEVLCMTTSCFTPSGRVHRHLIRSCE